MLVEQALFTSAQTRHARGYHLVARSSGVNDRLAQTLSVWGPTHDSLLGKSSDSDSLNFFPSDNDWGVLSRTVYGQSEYSGRGGFRIETNILLVSLKQLKGYRQNPLLFGRAAMALGYLRLRTVAPGELPAVMMPDSSLLPPAIDDRAHAHQLDHASESLIEEIVDRLRGDRVAVFGADDVTFVVSHVLERLSERRRAALSFTTGLKPSLHRKFDLQFLPAAENHYRRDLEASGITCIDAFEDSRSR